MPGYNKKRPNTKSGDKKRPLQKKKTPIRTSPKVFEDAYLRRIGQTPVEWIQAKVRSGTALDTIKYLFEINAAAIAERNHCVAQTFERYYARYLREKDPEENIVYEQRHNTVSTGEQQCPANAGKKWTKEDEMKLCQLYDYGCDIHTIAAYFQRTENAIVERLIRSGKIKCEEYGTYES